METPGSQIEREKGSGGVRMAFLTVLSVPSSRYSAGTVKSSTCSKRLVIDSQWVSKALDLAGRLQPRRLNN